MPWLKRDIVDQAFEEIGLAGYAFDLQPQQMNKALQSLDNMMATWNGKGLRLGYALSSGPTSSDLDQDSGLPDRAIEAVVLSLAVRLAPGFGKTVSPDTKRSASQAYKQLMSQAAKPIEMQLDVSAVPKGAGHKQYLSRDPFLKKTVPDLDAGPDATLEFD